MAEPAGAGDSAAEWHRVTYRSRMDDFNGLDIPESLADALRPSTLGILASAHLDAATAGSALANAARRDDR